MNSPEVQQSNISSTSSGSTTRSPGQRKTKSNSITSEHRQLVQVPPCKVCHGKGTGLHYGVTTCEACKVFFGRRLNRENKARCKVKGNCKIESGQRICVACRYQKCLDLGMSKDAIKIGRCTNERKSREIEEVKKLGMQGARVKEERKFVPNSPTEVTPMDTEVKHTAEMDKIIAQMTQVHLKSTPDNKMFYNDIHQNEEEYMRKKQLENNLYGPIRPVTNAEYNEIHEQTQIDIDGRRAQIKMMIPLIEKNVTKLLNFAKSVPLFEDLCAEDKVKLVKASCMECWGFQFTTLYNTTLGLLVYPYDASMILSLDDIVKFQEDPNSSLYQDLARNAERTQQLDLTEEETILTSALCLMIGGELGDANLSPHGAKIASQSADYLLDAIQYLIAKNHDPEDRTIAKILLILTDMRTVAQEQKQFYRNFIKASDGLGLPQTFIELFVP